jgi:CxxC-x17-CxxC domain-containing protein
MMDYHIPLSTFAPAAKILGVGLGVCILLRLAMAMAERGIDRLVEGLRGARVKRARSLQDVIANSATDFERLCTALFAAKGYKARRVGGQADGGIDLVATSDTGKVIVQCKRYSSKPVGVKVVRELLGVLVAEKAEQGFVITTSRFTKEAADFARSQPITLMDGDAFVREVRTHLPKTLIEETLAEAAAPPTPPAVSLASVTRPAKVAAGYPITCSECGAQDTVFFEPWPGKKLLCQTCYVARRNARSGVPSATQ